MDLKSFEINHRKLFCTDFDINIFACFWNKFRCFLFNLFQVHILEYLDLPHTFGGLRILKVFLVRFLTPSIMLLLIRKFVMVRQPVPRGNLARAHYRCIRFSFNWNTVSVNGHFVSPGCTLQSGHQTDNTRTDHRYALSFATRAWHNLSSLLSSSRC